MADSRRGQFVRFTVSVVFSVAMMGGVDGNAQGGPRTLGIFDGQTDVGSVTPPGMAVFDQGAGAYTITSAGANLWSTTDGFHLLWKKVSGDVVLTADVKLADANSTASPHRKALLIFRQTLDDNAMYADAAVHGNGETALQYRAAAGDTTQDIAFEIGAPRRGAKRDRDDEREQEQDVLRHGAVEVKPARGPVGLRRRGVHDQADHDEYPGDADAHCDRDNHQPTTFAQFHEASADHRHGRQP